MKKIGIFGGTFNPVHSEHVKIVCSAIEELQLDKVVVMPTCISPHKNSTPAPAEDRLNMLKLAFQGIDKVEISDFEISNGGKSYTYLTVEHFKKTTDAHLFLIVGGDMLKDFKNWKYPQRILNACDLCAFVRQDLANDFYKEKEYFNKNFNKQFTLLKYVPQPFSSTEIRIYNSLNLNIENYVSKQVAAYIKAKKLYCGQRFEEFIQKTLPEKRLIHTANVVVTALKKAKELNLDVEQVKTAALLHDCAKYIDYKTVNGFNLPKDVPAPVVHAFLGAYICEKVLKIDDVEILDAIKYHTSGKANMSKLSKLIFVADMIEKDRDYLGVDKLRELYDENFELCFHKCLEEEFTHLINKKSVIYFETINAFNYYIKNKKGNNNGKE